MTLERGWHPDPMGRYEQRFWNGTAWTSQVHANGHVTSDPYSEPAASEPVEPAAAERPDLRRQYLHDATEVYVRQRVAVGKTAYDYLDVLGRTVATVVQVRQTAGERLLRLVYPLQTLFAEHEFEVRDHRGRVALTLVRPEDTDLLVVGGPDLVGEVERVGPGTLAMRASGHEIGRVVRSRRSGVAFDLLDAEGRCVGRLHKQFTNAVRELVTVSDAYALTLDEPVDETYRTLALMTPVAIDEAHFEVDWAHLVNDIGSLFR